MQYTVQQGYTYHMSPIKGSKFIGLIFNITDKKNCQEILEQVRARYHDATHHCYAYKIGAIVKSSDDGEPSGTAGRPILHIIQQSPLDNILLIVVRYFGGTMLGAPGLVRAYSQCAKQTRETAPKIPYIPVQDMIFTIAYDYHGAILQLCQHYHAQIIHQQSGIQHTIHVRLAQDVANKFQEQLQYITHNTVQYLPSPDL